MTTEPEQGSEQQVIVHTFGLDDQQFNALFDQVAAAAHALDEEVFCSAAGRVVAPREGIDTQPEGVTQTILAGRDDGVPGNCVQAALASLLGLPIDAVPHFLLWDQWNYRLSEWVQERGYAIAVHSVDSVPDSRCIVAGLSPRGIQHVCVAEGGQIAWDPHPSRAGLTSIDEAWFITGTDHV